MQRSGYRDVIKGCVQHLSHVWLFASPWTVARQAPLSMGFPRQNTGVRSHFLLQGISISNPVCNQGFLHCRQILRDWARAIVAKRRKGCYPEIRKLLTLCCWALSVVSSGIFLLLSYHNMFHYFILYNFCTLISLYLFFICFSLLSVKSTKLLA